MRALALSQSSLDYVDLHTYPTGHRYSLEDDLESAEIGSLPAGKPRIIGEVGAFRFAHRDALAAAVLGPLGGAPNPEMAVEWPVAGNHVPAAR
jgi:hypothetical protein